MKNRSQSAPKNTPVIRAARRQKPQVLSQSLSRFGSAAAITAALLASAAVDAPATVYYWDTDGSDSGNVSTSGVNLGGTGTWDTATSNWWDATNPLTLWPNSNTDTAVFTGASNTPYTVTLTSGIIANGLSFIRSGYTLTGGDLTFDGTAAGLRINLGESAVIDSQILGTAGLTKTGGGVVRLGNATNTYTGTTTISNGALVISSGGALGSDSSAVVVTGFNPVAGSTNLRGFGGGSLVIDGLSSGVTLTRDLSLQGQGPIADRGGALVSYGDNTLSGSVAANAPYVVGTSSTNLNTNIISGSGKLTISGPLNVQGTAATTILNFGATNQTGVVNYEVNGALSGTGTISKSGSGTLILNPSSSTGFSGSIRTGGSNATGQSAIRITSPGVLGTRTATGNTSVLDLNGGILEVLMDAPSVLAGGTPANVFGRVSSTIMADRALGGTAINQTVPFGQFAFDDNQTMTFNSRNGYGMSFGVAPVTAAPGGTAGDNNSTFNNNLQGGTLTFVGNFWSNANTSGSRNVAFGGNGDTLINGNIIANGGASQDHSLTKGGAGTMTILGTGSTLDGVVNVNQGTLALTDFRSIGTANTTAINIGSSNLSGVLSIIGNNVALANLTTSRPINLGGTSGAATILANQTGTSPGLVFNGGFTALANTAKTLTLGGTNTGDNRINAAIPNAGTSAVSLTKIDGGTWSLAGSNNFTGTTTISEGTLRLVANAAASTILADASTVAFNTSGSVSAAAGGTLQLQGAAGQNNVETIGGINASQGANTIELTPGAAGTASIIFNGRNIADAATVNVAGSNGTTNVVTLTGAPVGLVQPNLFFGGADFAFNTATAAGVLRAPVYGTDPTFATAPGAATLPAGQSNFNVTGNITAQTSTTASTLRFATGANLTLASGATLTVRTGAGGTDGGILVTGNNTTISGGTALTTGGSGSLQLRVNGASDTLTISTPLSSGTTGGITKSGAGTLILTSANNGFTGGFNLNQGITQLASGGALSTAGNAINIRQGATLDMGGSNVSVNAINNAGTITNSGGSPVTLTVGGANGTGLINGTIQNGTGGISVVKIGTGGQTWSGLNSYTGSTTIGSTGVVIVTNLANGGVNSSLGASSNAASNLVFNGASATQAYGGLNYTGTAAVSTDRLFTFGGSAASSGARIQANGVNSVPVIFSNTGALAFTAGASTVSQGLVLNGSSTGDNRFYPQITNPGGLGAVTTVYKSEVGIWHLGNSNNTYSGSTFIQSGALGGTLGTSIPDASNIVISGGGILLTSGTVTSRSIGTGANNLQFTGAGGGGFAAADSKLTVNLGPVQWGAGTIAGSAGFVGAGPLILGLANASFAEVEIANNVELLTGAAASGLAYMTNTAAGTITLTSGSTSGFVLGQPITGTGIPANALISSIDSNTVFRISTGFTSPSTSASNGALSAVTTRTINVNDNTSTGSDQAIISGVISGTGIGVTKAGAGNLTLTGANTYTGVTSVTAGTLTVRSLGNSASPGATSVGDSGAGNTNAGAITLGNGGTGGALLQYIGAGEVSDRKIRFNSTTGAPQIHADGSGALVLTNVVNDLGTGAKTLTLRGTNVAGNMITSQLSDNNGALGVTVDGSATWILTNSSNNYTGTTTAGAGALGVGADTALGTGNFDWNNGSVFAYGGDRTIGNTTRLLNNTTASVFGDYNLTIANPFVNLAAANNVGLNNNIVAGKSLTFNGMVADSLTGTRIFTIDGSGHTVFNGNITTTTGFGVQFTKTGNGVLELRGTGGNFNHGTAAANIVNIDVDRGTLRLGANEVIPHSGTAAAYGGVVLTPEAATFDTATLDLNGFNETITVLSLNTDGGITIDNTSTAAASLTFGANNAAITFGNQGARTITNSGGGALSITKTGTAAANIPLGYTITHTGTTGVSGGSLTIASAVNGTTGLSVTNTGSTLALTGGLTSPGAITSIVAENGTTLSLADGAGSQITNLNTLTLGSTGGTLTTLNLNVGDIVAGDQLGTDRLELALGGALNLFAGNQITFNLSDAGLNPSSTYVLLDATNIGGGFTSGPLANTDYLLGSFPGGFTTFTLTANNNQVFVQTGTLITGASYWTALTNNSWNGAANNWSTDKAGTTPSGSVPGQGTDVVFRADNVTGTAAINTTLDNNFKIASLTFEASTNPGDTPSQVNIASGTPSTSRLEIAAQASSAGVAITAGGPALASISAPVRLTNDQTWTVADSGSAIVVSGPLQGGNNVDLVKEGAGRVAFTAAADPLFNTGTAAATVTINAGTLEIGNVAALGAGSAAAGITINSGGAFYYNNGTSGVVPNALTLNGGTLSAGGNNQTYSSASIPVNADSFINLRDQNSASTSATARIITIPGVLSGTGSLTVNSNSVLSAGNALNGSLTLGGANSGWSGALNLVRGTVTATNVGALGTGNITADNGRIIFNAGNGQTFNIAQNLTLTNAGTGILELQADNSAGTPTLDMTANFTGTVTMNGGSTNALRLLQNADNFSILNISGPVVIGNNASISVAGSATRPVVISGVISETGGARSLTVNDDLGGWGQTNQTLRLLGLNTFTGNLTLSEGTLEYNTVTNAGGAASALGQGSTIAMGPGAAALRFIGTTSQSTNRPITTTGVATLGANGTGGASITYSGAITVGPTSDGSQLILTGLPGSQGIISGGITQSGDAADMTVNGGTWTIQSGTSRVGDQITVTGASTILNVDSGLFQVRNDVIMAASAALNLNGTGVLSFSTPNLSADASLLIRDGSTVTLGANEAIVAADFDRLFIGQDADGAAGTFNTGTFTQTVGSGASQLILGERAATRIGNITGTGVANVPGGNIDLFRGSITAGLASNGGGALEKFGPGTVTMSGDNSGLASTGASIIYEGALVLDYTSSNTTKLRAASQLDMRGSDLTLNGNNGAATAQSVGSFTLGSGGANIITLNGGTGQDIVLNLGAITRAVNAQDGTVLFTLPAGTQSATNGITTTSLNNRSDASGILGGWAKVNDGTGVFFARNATNSTAGANIVAATTTATDNVATWGTTLNISDNTGFTGTLTRAEINSLRFNAAGASSVTIAQGGILDIQSGGILVTPNAGAGTRGIFGGTLASGAIASNVPELIITQSSASPFEISADIRVNHAITKAGSGVLELSGTNTQTGTIEIQDGTLQVSGGNAIGDTSLVNLSASRNSTFQLLSNETIGRLAGGQRQTNSDYGVVALGGNTLTIAQTAADTTYAGFITGTGTLIKASGEATPRNFNLTNISTGFTGSVIVNGGLFQMSGIGQVNASAFTVNKGGALILDNNGTTRSGTRILDSTPMTLNSADGTFSGATVPRGLAFRTDQDSGTSNNEAIGVLSFGSGASYATFEQSGGSNSRAFINATNFTRTNNATLNARGRALGSTAGTGGQSRLSISDATNQTAFIASMVGGASTAGQNVAIVPWAIGETFTGGLGAANMGNSLMTYTAAQGLRPLDLATEYTTFTSASSATQNVRESLTPGTLNVTGSPTINALVINHNDTSTAATTVNVAGAGAGQSLAVTSGAMLFTTNTAGTAIRTTTLGGFDSGITTGATNEYVISVVNPLSSGGATLTANITSPLASTADITKSGRGTLVLSGINTAGGGSRRTVVNEGVLEIADLDNIGGNSGALFLAGGTIRLGAGFTDDLTNRTITLLNGGGTIDTNGNSVAFAGSIGSGTGGLTKIGAGALTLGGSATYSGDTVISAGTVAIGANNAMGIGGNLTIAGAGTAAPNVTTLDLGTRTITHATVTTSGNNPVILGTGNISVSNGLFLNHTGNTTIDAVISGAGGLLKAQTNQVTLNGANTYTGTTEIQSGQINFSTIGNVGGGASSFGAPTSVENGVIRTGLTTTSVTLNYTGSGSTSNRIIAMQGTTGGLTITQSNTAGAALNLGTIQTEVAGAKTLTLNGASSAANSIAGIHEGATGALAVTKAGTGTWVLSGANTYTGNTLVSGGGVLRAGNSQAFGTVGTVTIQDTGTVLELANAVNIGRPLTVSNTGNAKTLRLLSGATTGEYSGNVSIAEQTAGNFVVNVDTGGSLTASGVISSTGATALAGITKTGPGTLVLSNGNTYRGTTAISDGIVTVQHNDGLGSPLEGTTVASGATLQLEGGSLIIVDEALTLNGAGETGQNGAVVNVSGTNAYGGNVTLGSPSTISTDDGSLGYTGNFSLGAHTLTSTGDNGAQTVIFGNITGTGGLTVNALSPAGHTLTLIPATTNSFTGATEINSNATLIAQDAGALGSTASVSINSGGTLLLAGSGDRVNDAAAINMLDGTFNTAGVAETVGVLTLSATNTISIIDLAGTNLNNILSFANSSGPGWTGQLHIYNWSGITRADQTVNGSYLASELDQIFFGNSTSGLTNTQLSSITFFSDAGSTSIGTAVWGIGGNGQIVPVPEPTGVAVGLALFGLAGWRERRRAAARRREERSADRQ